MLFARLFEMLAEVHPELGRDELDAPARRRAAVLLTEAQGMIRSAIAAGVIAEFDHIAPELSREPTVVELRLAYRGTLAWLAGLAWLSAPTDQSGEETI